jgi:hypothetical protein
MSRPPNAQFASGERERDKVIANEGTVVIFITKVN